MKSTGDETYYQRKKFSNNAVLVKIYIIQQSTDLQTQVMTARSQLRIGLLDAVELDDNFTLFVCWRSGNIFQASFLLF